MRKEVKSFLDFSNYWCYAVVLLITILININTHLFIVNIWFIVVECYISCSWYITDNIGLMFYKGYSFSTVKWGMIDWNLNALTLLPRNLSVWFAWKLLMAIALLIFIRGGVPRYRYDYLTKIGWLKFLGFTFIVFFYSLLFFILY